MTPILQLGKDLSLLIHTEGEDAGIAELVLGPVDSMPMADAQTHAALGSIWSHLANNPDVRAILIRSVGKGFCAGGTPEVVDEMLWSEAARLRVMREARDLVQGMLDCDVPIVSAINGAAVGAGAALALLADVSIASTRAKVIDGHTRLGVAAGDHAAVIWPLLCGMAKAKYYLLTCEALDGAEAERIGLVSLAVEPDQLAAKSREVARQLARGSRTALAHTKRSLNHWLRSAWPAFEHSLALEILDFAGQDAREGFQALNDKRAPRFEGPSHEVR